MAQMEKGPHKRVNVRPKRVVLAHRPHHVAGSIHSKIVGTDYLVGDLGPTEEAAAYIRRLIENVNTPVTPEEFEERVRTTSELRASIESLAERGGQDTDGKDESKLLSLRQQILGGLEEELQSIRADQPDNPFYPSARFKREVLRRIEAQLEDELGEEIMETIGLAFYTAGGTALQRAFGADCWIEAVKLDEGEPTEEVLGQYFMATVPSTDKKQRTDFWPFDLGPLTEEEIEGIDAEDYHKMNNPENQMLLSGAFIFGHENLNEMHDVRGRGESFSSTEAHVALRKKNVKEGLMKTRAFDFLGLYAGGFLKKQIKTKVETENQQM